MFEIGEQKLSFSIQLIYESVFVCQVLLNLVHDQLNCAKPKLDSAPSASNEISQEKNNSKDKFGEEQKEFLKAETFWENYLRRDCSPITDLFAGEFCGEECACTANSVQWNMSIFCSSFQCDSLFVSLLLEIEHNQGWKLCIR